MRVVVDWVISKFGGLIIVLNYFTCSPIIDQSQEILSNIIFLITNLKFKKSYILH